jgi:hypothetical protein
LQLYDHISRQGLATHTSGRDEAQTEIEELIQGSIMLRMISCLERVNCSLQTSFLKFKFLESADEAGAWLDAIPITSISHSCLEDDTPSLLQMLGGRSAIMQDKACIHV